jgi:hypothetical protein
VELRPAEHGAGVGGDRPITAEQLASYYVQHDPAKAAKAAKILREYSRAELVERLTRKYGANPSEHGVTTTKNAWQWFSLFSNGKFNTENCKVCCHKSAAGARGHCRAVLLLLLLRRRRRRRRRCRRCCY